MRNDWNLYRYVSNQPTAAIDPLGLKKVCCTEGAEHLLKEAKKSAQRAKDLMTEGFFEIGPGAEVLAATYCGGQTGVMGIPTTSFHPPAKKLGPCEFACLRVHEGMHGWVCKQFGPIWVTTPAGGDMDEALAYMAGGVCLLKAANQGWIDPDEDFKQYGPLPKP